MNVSEGGVAISFRSFWKHKAQCLTVCPCSLQSAGAHGAPAPSVGPSHTGLIMSLFWCTLFALQYFHILRKIHSQIRAAKCTGGGVNGTERAASIGMLQRWGGRMARVAEGRPGGPAGAAPHWCTRWNTVLRNQNRKQRAMSAPQACLPAATQHSTAGPQPPHAGSPADSLVLRADAAGPLHHVGVLRQRVAIWRQVESVVAVAALGLAPRCPAGVGEGAARAAGKSE